MLRLRTTVSILALALIAALANPGRLAAATPPMCTANIGSTPRTCPAPPSTPPAPTIVRDGYGVPHIRATSIYEAAWANGWITAQDRLVQAELTRRSATGQVAELFGAGQLGGDIDTRRQFYTVDERAYFFTTLSCRLQTIFQGYADGFNAYLDQIYSDPSLANVPHEFFFFPLAIRASGNGQIPSGVDFQIVNHNGSEVYRPGPWKVTDTVAIADLLAGEFGGGGGRQLTQLALLKYLQLERAKAGDADPTGSANAIFDDVRWAVDPTAPTSVPASGAVRPLRHQPVPLLPKIREAAPSVTASTLELPALVQTLFDWLDPTSSRFIGDAPLANAADLSPHRQRDFLATLELSTIERGLAAAQRRALVARERGRRFGVFTHWGSNMWMVSPEHSRSKNALLWGGPQEGFGNPNIDIEVYLNAPGLVVGGMGITGVPGVLIGEGSNYAWTTTSGEIDNSQVYVETLVDPVPPEPQAPGVNYLVQFEGATVPMDVRTEVFHYAGEDSSKPPAFNPSGNPPNNDPPLAYNVFRVHDCDPLHFHGFVMEFDLSANPKRAFSYKTAYWKNELATAEGFLGLNFAHDWQDFDDSVAEIVSLHNFGYADQDGNIAFWSAGARPNFPADFDDRLPADGTGGAEWSPFPDGSLYKPFSRDIYSLNPDQGYLANWNTKPADRSYIREGNSHDEHWGPIYRSTRIEFLIKSSPGLSFDDAERIEYDVGTDDNSTDTVRPAAPYLIPYIRQAYDDLQQAGSPLVDPAAHPTLASALQILETWNAYLGDLGQIYPATESFHYGQSYSPSLGQSGMSIFFQWWYALKSNLFGGGAIQTASGAASEPFVGAVNFADGSLNAGNFLGETTYNMFLHILEGPTAGVPQNFKGDYFGGHRDEIIIESLNDAITLLSGTGPLPQLSFGACDGSNVSTPGFGTSDPSTWPWSPPVSLDFDCLDSFAEPVLANGTHPTSFGKAPEQNRSTYMQMLEMDRPLRGENVIAPGQSGFIHHDADGKGTADPHMGDQAGLFRDFQYKPMRLGYPGP